MTDLTELRSADAYCRRLASRHYENFSVVSLILPSDIRLHLARIYAFCRTTDDLGDESDRLNAAAPKRLSFTISTFSVNVGPPANPVDPDLGLRRLETWAAQARDLWSDHPAPVHPVLIALRETVNGHAMPEQPFLDLIEANIQDQTVNSYQTWEELRAYCMLSAAPVGRMVLRVFGVDSLEAQTLSDDVCIGLQLANHAQDVQRDAAKGRSYLPREDVEGRSARQAVQKLCERAEQLLESGRTLEAMVPFQLRVQLSLYRLGGLAVISQIRELQYRTDSSRPSVSTLTKLRLIPRAIAESVRTLEHATPERAA